MLVKVKESVYYDKYQLLYDVEDKNISISKNASYSLVPATVINGTNLWLRLKTTAASSGIHNVRVDSETVSTTNPTSRIITVEAGAEHSVSLYNNASSSISYTYEYIKIFAYDRSLTVSKKGIPLRPLELKHLGNLGIFVIYGINPNDNIYYGGVITGTTTSATTGSITTGNCVGFLEINYNGNIVKVPYYS